MGAVLGTFGVERHAIKFTGQAAHSGSTPMAHRRDARGPGPTRTSHADLVDLLEHRRRVPRQGVDEAGRGPLAWLMSMLEARPE